MTEGGVGESLLGICETLREVGSGTGIEVGCYREGKSTIFFPLWLVAAV